MTFAGATPPVQDLHGFSAQVTVNIYDATGWTQNADGSFVPPAKLPAQPYAVATFTATSQFSSDAEYLRAASLAAGQAIAAAQAPANLAARVSHWQGRYFPVNDAPA